MDEVDALAEPPFRAGRGEEKWGCCQASTTCQAWCLAIVMLIGGVHIAIMRCGVFCLVRIPCATLNEFSTTAMLLATTSGAESMKDLRNAMQLFQGAFVM